MTVYKKVQFVAWEIYTGPIYSKLGDTRNNGKYTAIDYAGFSNNSKDRRINVFSQCVDIEGRVQFTKDAIEKAFDKADPNPEVLKIFMAPEFLYRGASGAYLHDLLWGWGKKTPFDLEPPFNGPWSGLFGSLKKLVSDDKYKDWVFIFGTAVSASLKAYKIEKKWIVDLNRSIEAYNTSLVIRGGTAENTNRYVQKYGVSPIDFIEYRLATECYKNGMIISPNRNVIIPKNALMELADTSIFSFDEICRENGKRIVFGLEICLDHYGYRHENWGGHLQMVDMGRLKDNGYLVDIQLVPSGGMILCENSIALQQNDLNNNSYAFNCDGLSCLGTNRKGAHIEIGEIRDNKLNILESYSNDFDNNISADSVALVNEVTIEELGQINALNLWRGRELGNFNGTDLPYGAGYIHASRIYPL